MGSSVFSREMEYLGRRHLLVRISERGFKGRT